MPDNLYFLVEIGMSRQYIDEDQLLSYLKQSFSEYRYLCKKMDGFFDGEMFCRLYIRDDSFKDV